MRYRISYECYTNENLREITWSDGDPIELYLQELLMENQTRSLLNYSLNNSRRN